MVIATPALERRAAAVATSAVTVRGVMQRSAELRFSPGGDTAWLYAFVEQPRGLPYLGVQRFGGDPTSLRAAQAKARLLAKGAEVVMYATGLALERTSFDPGHQALRLQGEVDIRPVSLPARHEQAAATTTAQEAA